MIRGRKRPLMQRREAKVETRCNLHNRFDIEVVDAATGTIKQRAQAENVICNALWTKLFTPAAYFVRIHYGTGAGTPAAGDTSLFTFLGYGTPATVDDVYTSNPSSGFMSVRRKIVLSESTAVGSTLTEVGIGYGTTAATLCTHAMLKDMNGNQISIAKTDTDIINIYATVFLHWDVSSYDEKCRFVISPKATYLTKWMMGLVSSGEGYVKLLAQNGTAQPFYTSYGNYYGIGTINTDFYVATVAFAYSSANKTLTITATRLGVSNANFPLFSFGLYSQAYESGAVYAYEPVIEMMPGMTGISATSIVGEAIGTGDGNATDFATDFPFISLARIYVNAVEQTAGVTVDEGVPLTPSNMGRYFLFMPQYSVATNVASITMTGGGGVAVSGDYATYYNPYYAKGITAYTAGANTKVEISDNLTDWTELSTTSGAKSVSATYQNYKYWRITATSGNGGNVTVVTSSGVTATNIHFATAPASGAVITADYTTATVAKDANHVFDFSMVITLGEQTT